MHGLGKTLVIIVSCNSIDSWPLQISALSVTTAELFLHGVTDTCSFLETPFFYSKGVFWGVIIYKKKLTKFGTRVGTIAHQ